MKRSRTTLLRILALSFVGLLVWLLKPFAERDDPRTASALESIAIQESRSASSLTRNSPKNQEAKKKARELTNEEIEELGVIFRIADDPKVRRQAFEKLLAHLDSTNAWLIKDQLAHLSADSQEYHEFYHAWGRVAGKKAALKAGHTSRQAIVATMEGWAGADPIAAREFFDGLQSSAHNGDRSTNHFSQEYLRKGLVEGLAEANTNQATAFVNEQFENKQVGEKTVGTMIRTVANQMVKDLGLAEASEWATNVPDALRNEALAGVAREYAATDIQGALDWLGSLGDEIHQGAAYYHTFDTWLREDPGAARDYISSMPESYRRDEAISALTQRTVHEDGPAAVKWTESISDPGSRNRILSDTFNTWARSDAAAASEYLAEMPSSVERDHAINGFAGRISKDDPTAAVAWADQITDTALRETALTTVALSYLESDVTAANAWLPESGLSNETIERISNPSPEDVHYMKYLSP